MARVTVEDCILKVPNRFDLVVYAGQRARSIAAGATLTLERDDDKNPVVALREVAEGTIEPAELEEAVVRGMQKIAEMDEPEAEEEMEMLTADALAQTVAEDLGQVVEEDEEEAVADAEAGAEAEAGEEPEAPGAAEERTEE